MNIKSCIRSVSDKVLSSFPSSAVLMLHGIQDDPGKDYKNSFTVDRFKMLVLKYKDNWDSLENVVNFPGRRKICLTFDDGYDNIYTTVYPFLKEHGIPFTTFVSTANLNKDGYMTEEQVIEISKDPITDVESHCCNHRPLAGLDEKDQTYELVESRKKLEQLIGQQVKYIAYPFGQFDETTVKLMRSEPYNGAFISYGGTVNTVYNKLKYRLPRLAMNNYCYETSCEILDNLLR